MSTKHGAARSLVIYVFAPMLVMILLAWHARGCMRQGQEFGGLSYVSPTPTPALRLYQVRGEGVTCYVLETDAGMAMDCIEK